MRAETKQVVVAMTILALTFVGIILVSNIIRHNHDALVHERAVQTCKEFK